MVIAFISRPALCQENNSDTYFTWISVMCSLQHLHPEITSKILKVTTMFVCLNDMGMTYHALRLLHLLVDNVVVRAVWKPHAPYSNIVEQSVDIATSPTSLHPASYH